MGKSEVISLDGRGYFKKLFAFAVPVMLSYFLQSLYGAADTYVIGNFAADGEISLAAIACTGQILNLILGLFMGLSVGAGVCVSHAIGAKKTNEISKIVHTAILLSFVSGVALAIIGVIVAPWLLALVDTPASIIAPATLYMQIIYLGAPAQLIYNYCAAIIRSTGDSKRPMIYLSISGVVNVLLNLLLVVVIPLDVAGVAIGTVVAQYLSAVLVLVHMLVSRGDIHFSPRRLGIDKKSLVNMIKIGLPSGIQGMLFSLANVTIQSSVNSFNSTALLAAENALGKLDAVAGGIDTGVRTAGITFVGQCVGAKKYRDIKKVIFYCILIILVFFAVITPIFIVFKDQLLGIFLKDNEAALRAATPRFVCLTCMHFICAIMNLGSAALRGMGKSTYAMVISLIGACGLRILWLKTVFKVWVSPWCIYITYPITWVITAAVLYAFVFALLRKSIKSEDIDKEEMPS